jgi:hypothetical protein
MPLARALEGHPATRGPAGENGAAIRRATVQEKAKAGHLSLQRMPGQSCLSGPQRKSRPTGKMLEKLCRLSGCHACIVVANHN